MTKAGIDLDAYFARIEWGGELTPTFDTLAGIMRAHMSRIPFENLDVLLQRPVRLDLDGLEQKLVRGRRGGYCFEHSTLFAAMLEQIGFHPVRHAARVLLMASRATSPRTHMFLTVPLAEGTFAVDPGFGAQSPNVPIALEDRSASRGEGETHWLVRDGRHWVLRVRSGDKTIDAWVSTLEEENPVDFEMGNHFTSTHPSSPFVNRILMSSLTEDGRVTVMNRDVTIQRATGADSRELADRSALRMLLREHFGFDLPEVLTLRVPSIPEWN
jgi:N-hydroxyarylamine O-acetyltransferase